MGKRTATTIRGIVIDATWNRVGEITAVDIAGYDEKRYRIADDHKCMQLQGLNKKWIVVDGFIESKK